RGLHRGRCHVSGTGKPEQGELFGNLVPSPSTVGQRQGRPGKSNSIARRWRGSQPRRAAWGTGQAAIESLTSETKRMQPPLLYDLTELQRHANRLFGFSAQQTLDLAQALYERYKLISYPRTDSRHLSADVAATVPRIVAAISKGYQQQVAAGTGERPLSNRYVDDSKVSDHHAIIPTAVSPEQAHLSADERKTYDLICR